MTITLNGGIRFIPPNSYARQENLRKNFNSLQIVTWPTVLDRARERHRHYFADTSRAIPNAAAAANPPISAVRSALDPRGIPV